MGPIVLSRLEVALIHACATVGIALGVRIRGKKVSLPRRMKHADALSRERLRIGMPERARYPELVEWLESSNSVTLSLPRASIDLAAAQAAQFATRFDTSGWSDFCNISGYQFYRLADGPERLARLGRKLELVSPSPDDEGVA